MSINSLQKTPRNQNYKHAVTFFALSMVILLLPIFMPSHHSQAKPSPRPSTTVTPSVAIAPSATSTPNPTSTPNSSSTPANTSATPSLTAGAGDTVFIGGESDENHDDSGSSPGLEFREKLQNVVVSLLMIIALIFVVLKGLQKYWPGLVKPSASEPSLMEVLSQQTIAPGVHLSLVRVCNKTVVIGFTEHSVSVLCEITAEEMEKAREQNGLAVAAALDATPIKTPGEVYREILNRYLSIVPGFGSKR